MRKDMVFISVPRNVRDTLKVRAAKKGMSMKDYLSINLDEEHKTMSEAERRFRDGLF